MPSSSMISVTSSRTPALTSSSAVMIIDPVKDGTSSATAVDATSASARTRTRTNEKMFFMSAISISRAARAWRCDERRRRGDMFYHALDRTRKVVALHVHAYVESGGSRAVRERVRTCCSVSTKTTNYFFFREPFPALAVTTSASTGCPSPTSGNSPSAAPASALDPCGGSTCASAGFSFTLFGWN